MADLVDVREKDVIVDPSCGTGGFLIASLYRMIGGRQLTPKQIRNLVSGHLWGFESDPLTAGLCVANMILRGDGTSGVVKGNCFTDPRYPESKANIVLGNPPFPHKKSDDQPEKFVDRALEALRVRGVAAMVVPASMLGKTGVKKKWRHHVLRDNTLQAVIKLPNELFEPYATAYTNIAILEKGVKHKPDNKIFFARIENDGYRLKKNVRVDQPGEQLTETLDALHNRTELAGWRSWRTLDTKTQDWSPGAYIESAVASESHIRREVDTMFRSDASLHSYFADRLAMFYQRLDNGSLAGRPYSTITGRKAFTIDGEPGLLGNYFYVYYGQRELHSKEGLESGDALVVSSSGEYNGCYGFFEYTNLIKPPFATVPSTGSIGDCFVQRLPCGVTDDCLLLFPKPGVPIEMLYVAAAVVRTESWRFSYGRKITPSRMARFKMPLVDGLLDWIKRRMSEANSLGKTIVDALADERGIKEEFSRLLVQWEQERPRGANVEAMASHPVYQSIIGMGLSAVPLLLAELKCKPSHWFAALNAITGANPVPPEDAGKVKRMVAAWIEWGTQRGYINDVDRSAVR